MDFLAMARELTDRRVFLDYWIIGGEVHRNGYRAQLEQRVGELGLGERVTFLGHCRNVPELLRELDVVVCCSHVEPLGLCLLEAMACERPVVATRVGGIPEVVDDGKTGILVSPQSPEQLANAVQRLMDDPRLRQRMGLAGRERVIRLFDHKAYLNNILSVYEGVLQIEANSPWRNPRPS